MEAPDEPDGVAGELIESASKPISLLGGDNGFAKDENNIKNKMRTTTNIIIIKGETEVSIGCCV